MSKRHKPEEVVAKLRQIEVLVGQGKTVAEVVRAIGVMEGTDYWWRAKYGGLKLDQVRRLKQLEQENSRLAAPPFKRQLPRTVSLGPHPSHVAIQTRLAQAETAFSNGV